MSVTANAGLLGRLQALSRRARDLITQSVGSAARAGRAAGRALTPEAEPPAGVAVVDRLEAVASRLARLEERTAGQVGGTLGDRVASVDRLVQEAAALSKALGGRAAVHPLPPYDAEQPVGRVARQVLAALASRPPPPPRVARAVIGLAHPRPEIRRLALEFLGTPPEPVALPLLELVYARASGAERRAILAVARDMEPGGRRSALIEEALADADPAVRLTGVRAVPRGAKMPAALDDLATGDPRAEVRRASLQTLIAGESIKRSVRVEQGLRDPETQVRLDTLHAAAATRDPAVVLPLMRALMDADVEVRRAAAAAVGELTGLDPEFDPEASAPQRRDAASRLRGRWGRARFATLAGPEDEGAGPAPLGEDELAQPLDAEFLVEPRSDGRRSEPG